MITSSVNSTEHLKKKISILHKLRYFHTMEYYSEMKRNELLTKATIWVNF